MNLQHILEVLDHVNSPEDEDQLKDMVEAIDQLGQSPPIEMAEPLLRIFERFPTADGYETFWSVLHALEATPGYEEELIKSVMRQPAEFNVLMVNRLLNAGIQKVGETDLLELLNQVMTNTFAPASVKKDAAQFRQRHISKLTEETRQADAL